MVFVGLTSALFCHSFPRLLTVLRMAMINIVHIVDLCGSSRLKWKSENVVFEIDWNDFILSISIHLHKFSFLDDHVSTVMSSSARDF